MIINKNIIQMFSVLKIPVTFMEYKGSEDKYIVFSTTGQIDSNFQDDNYNSETVNVGLNYFYKNPEDMAFIDSINTILRENDFKIISSRDVKVQGSEFFNRAYFLRKIIKKL